MAIGSYLRVLRVAALAAGAGRGLAASSGAAAAAGAHRLLLAEATGSSGLSAGLVAAYTIISIILVAVSGLMAGLVLGLLSLDKVDLEVAKRTGTEKQKWLVSRVEPFTEKPHYTMCSLVVVNSACNTALPLFIDRLLNPLAALLISVTAILIFAEIAPQAVCKRYGLEIGAYCSWLVRLIMVLTAPVSWPLGKLLDWLLGEESALFRRQELKALVGLHAETQQDGSVGALTSDEVQVIQGALDMANKTAQAVMTPLPKVFMLSGDAVINQELLARVLAAGHSRVPVYEGDNKQALLGLILVKELLVVDETKGTRVRDLCLRDLPFLRADVPLYDVMKIFRFGRKHMACLTRVAADPSTGKASGARGNGLFRRASPQLATTDAGAQVEEAVGIITIEDVLEELLQAEIVDETDQYEDNLQTVHVAPQAPLRDLPPNLRRFLSPRRSMHQHEAAVAASGRRSVDVARVSAVSSASAGSRGAANGHPSSPRPHDARPGSGLSGVSHATGQRNVSVSSLGAAAAASALVVAGGPGSAEAGAVAAGVAAGIRAAELNVQGNPPVLRPPLPRPGSRQRSASVDFGAAQRSSELGSSGRMTPEFGSAGRHTPDFLAPSGGSGGDVTIELGEVPRTPGSATDGSEAGGGGGTPRDQTRQPLVRQGRPGS